MGTIFSGTLRKTGGGDNGGKTKSFRSTGLSMNSLGKNPINFSKCLLSIGGP